jgi:hypothetical protein
MVQGLDILSRKDLCCGRCIMGRNIRRFQPPIRPPRIDVVLARGPNAPRDIFSEYNAPSCYSASFPSSMAGLVGSSYGNKEFP